MSSGQLPFQGNQTWPQRVYDADRIHEQVKTALTHNALSMPQTPRLDDLRLIVNNVGGQTLSFMNPGKHSDMMETIPADGKETAIMVMVKGDTIEEQHRNAQALVETYRLDERGAEGLLEALKDGLGAQLIEEAYGPASFEKQTARLETVNWEKFDGSHDIIEPLQVGAAAYGVRSPSQELVYKVQVPLYIQGTDSVPELIETTGMCIAVSEDWETGELKTRPIVPSVAKTYYDAHYEGIPEVTLDVSGFVKEVALPSGEKAYCSPPVENESAPAHSALNTSYVPR